MRNSNRLLDRRGALRSLAAPSAALLWAGSARANEVRSPSEPAVVVDPPACILTPQSDDGPYFLDARLVRRAIAEDRPGVPLSVDIRLIEAGRCVPIEGARVDIWHADAQGAYSGYKGQGDSGTSTVGQTFLRGTQISDAQGLASFQTVYPGWYEGRATHIHAKVFIEGRGVLSCQLFLPDALNEFIYTNVPDYAHRARTRATINRNDPLILHDDPEHRAFCAIREAPDRYVASVVLGVDPGATAPTGKGPPIAFFLARALGLSLGPKAAMGSTRAASLVPGLR